MRPTIEELREKGEVLDEVTEAVLWYLDKEYYVSLIDNTILTWAEDNAEGPEGAFFPYNHYLALAQEEIDQMEIEYTILTDMGLPYGCMTLNGTDDYASVLNQHSTYTPTDDERSEFKRRVLQTLKKEKPSKWCSKGSNYDE